MSTLQNNPQLNISVINSVTVTADNSTDPARTYAIAAQVCKDTDGLQSVSSGTVYALPTEDNTDGAYLADFNTSRWGGTSINFNATAGTTAERIAILGAVEGFIAAAAQLIINDNQ